MDAAEQKRQADWAEYFRLNPGAWAQYQQPQSAQPQQQVQQPPPQPSYPSYGVQYPVVVRGSNTAHKPYFFTTNCLGSCPKR
jgi:hypothetical protein